jgi:hypothetical protein
MGEFAPILQLMVFVFFALQLERINHSLKDITKTLNQLSNRIDSNSLHNQTEKPHES